MNDYITSDIFSEEIENQGRSILLDDLEAELGHARLVAHHSSSLINLHLSD